VVSDADRAVLARQARRRLGWFSFGLVVLGAVLVQLVRTEAQQRVAHRLENRGLAKAYVDVSAVRALFRLPLYIATRASELRCRRGLFHSGGLSGLWRVAACPSESGVAS
jgi:hypothetical protein